jgi:hypothetical protein
LGSLGLFENFHCVTEIVGLLLLVLTLQASFFNLAFIGEFHNLSAAGKNSICNEIA